ncbi:MAG: hypothetical protein ACYTDW_00620 [Planctomycetota bacterium]
MTKWLDRLDSKSGWQFVGIIYIVRWCLIVPYMIASKFLFTDAQISEASLSKLQEMNPITLFTGIVIISPLLETLLECSLPFFIISVIHRKKGKLPARPWLFIIISALLMVLLHPMLAAILPSLITGLFLAYCYAHFANRNFSSALLYTAAFHAAINIVGWTMIVFAGTA